MSILRIFSPSSSDSIFQNLTPSKVVKATIAIATVAITFCVAHKIRRKKQTERRITTRIKGMTVKEKVGQMLIAHFNGKVANEHAQKLIKDVKIGGIILYKWANGIESPAQVATLTTELQQMARKEGIPPLFICADQEGGIVNRLDQGFTIFPGNKALAMTGDSNLAEECAFAMGQEMRSVGVNFNLSPVVDVNNNPRNPVIGLRSFGESPEKVTEFGEAAVRGYHKAGLSISLKHFPGHGDTESDSHYGLPTVKKSKDQLESNELFPFAKLAKTADSVMTAHIVFPALDSENCATMSKPILDILRNEMHFNGVVMTDSLVMDGFIKNSKSLEEGTIRAVNAGCNMLILGGKDLIGSNSLELNAENVSSIHQNLCQAVEDGLIPLKVIDDSVARILTLKEKYPLTTEGNKTAIATLVAKHKPLAQKIATLALRVKINKPLGALNDKTLTVIAPKIVEGNVRQTSLLHLSQKTEVLFLNLNPTAEECETSQKLSSHSDVTIFLAYNAWKNGSQEKLIHTLFKTEKPTILMVLRDPLDGNLFPESQMIVTTHSPVPHAIEAASQYLLEL